MIYKIQVEFEQGQSLELYSCTEPVVLAVNGLVEDVRWTPAPGHSQVWVRWSSAIVVAWDAESEEEPN